MADPQKDPSLLFPTDKPTGKTKGEEIPCHSRFCDNPGMIRIHLCP